MTGFCTQGFSASCKHFHLLLFSHPLSFSSVSQALVKSQLSGHSFFQVWVYFSCWTLVEECEHMSPAGWSKLDLLLLCWSNSHVRRISNRANIDTVRYTHTQLSLSVEDSHVSSRQWDDEQTDRNVCDCVWLKETPDKQKVKPGQHWSLLNPLY